jgi:polysaccharide export outer membrane protein
MGLAAPGCQAILGPEDGSTGGPGPAQIRAKGTPYPGQSTGVVQASYQAPGATFPGGAPGPVPPQGFTPAGPGLPSGVVLGPPHDAGPLPTELAKVSLPAYRVGPPDILFIDTVRMLPRPPYHIEPLDVLAVTVTGTLDKQPIAGKFVVGPDGAITLGYGYGSVAVGGKTVQEAEVAVQAHLARTLRNAQVALSLAELRVVQYVRGQHLVRPDGTVGLGTYGCIYVAGLTLGQIKCKIEEHLAQWFHEPQVSVDVFAYNSKFYYVIFDGGGYGQIVLPFPATGTETVLDAIARAGGLPAVSSKKRIWLARPAPAGHGCLQVLPVDWNAITLGGDTTTNYQIFPGDRVFVDADCLIKTDNWIAKILSPFERVLGITLLGATTVESIRFAGSNNFNNGAVVVP